MVGHDSTVPWAILRDDKSARTNRQGCAGLRPWRLGWPGLQDSTDELLLMLLLPLLLLVVVVLLLLLSLLLLFLPMLSLLLLQSPLLLFDR